MRKKTIARETGRHSLQLIGVAILLAVGINLVHPERIPWVEDWANRVEARAVREDVALVQLSELIGVLRESSRLIVDARPVEEYVRGHIPGAISIPLDSEIPPSVLSAGGTPIFYCSGSTCDDGLLLALDVRAAGRPDVSVFIGGIALWESELLALTEGDAP